MKDNINPKHYKATINGQEIQVADVIEAFHPKDAHLSQAIKYLLRAGKKGRGTYVQDVSKALWWCARAILYRGGTIDLPGGATYENVTSNRKPLLSPQTQED